MSSFTESTSTTLTPISTTNNTISKSPSFGENTENIVKDVVPSTSPDEIINKFRENHPKSIERVMVFDLETTGKRTSTSYVVQMSYIIYNVKQKTFDKSVDHIINVGPRVFIPPETIAIHKITPEISNTQGIPMLDALKEFYDDYLSVDLIICHNIKYDIPMIHVELQRHWKSMEKSHPYALSLFNPTFMKVRGIQSLCTMLNTTDICCIPNKNPKFSTYKWPSLMELYKTLFTDSPTNLHNSMIDCLVCLRCYLSIWLNDQMTNAEFETHCKQVALR